VNEQPPLIELPEQPGKAVSSGPQAPQGKPRFIRLDRQQQSWAPLDIDGLIPAQHPARAIWDLVSRLDLSGFEEEIRSRGERAGRPRWSPHLLASVWIYASTQGMASARGIEQELRHEPGLRWLCANEEINHHTLSDFRTSRKEKLDALFVQVLGILEQEELVDLETVMQDGTKVGARASRQSFHRRKTLQEHCDQAMEFVEEMKRREDNGEAEAGHKRRLAAQQRAAQERLARMEAALAELSEREKQATGKERAELRVSESEPEARKMKRPNGGWEASYNVQVLTDAKEKIVVGVAVTQAANDTQELVGGLQEVKDNTGRQPERMVADGGYASRENVEAMAGRNVAFIAPWKGEEARAAGNCQRQGMALEFSPAAFHWNEDSDELQCPAGRQLELKKRYRHHGLECKLYQARAEECLVCSNQPGCCPHPEKGGRRVERVQETAVMKSYLERMQTAEAQRWYKRRSEVAEFPHLWWKGLWEWRRFSVRGLAKAAKEALWVALAYNIQQWIRLRWMPRLGSA
jgi:transposase